MEYKIPTDMKKIVLLMAALLLVCGGASAQNNVLNRLKNRAKNAAESNPTFRLNHCRPIK